MFKKFLTVVIIPQKTSAVKKRKIPVILISLVVMLVIGLMGAGMWMVIDYLSIRSGLINITKLQQEFDENEKEIGQFKDKYDQIQMNFEHLKALDYKLRTITSLEREKKYKRKQLSEKEKKEQLAKVSREGILSIIASNVEEIAATFNEKEFKFNNLVKFYASIKNPVKRIPSRWPSKGLLINEYGVKADPYTNQIISHFGVNIATSRNAPVKATADGVVLYVGKDNDLVNLIIIDHGNGFVTRYGFIANPEVEEGDLIHQDDMIAKVSNIGTSNDYRLYYEILLNGVTQDPNVYIHQPKVLN